MLVGLLKYVSVIQKGKVDVRKRGRGGRRLNLLKQWN